MMMKMPTIDGTVLGWKGFLSMFCSKIDREPDFSDADKSCLLLTVFVDPEAKSLAQGAVNGTQPLMRPWRSSRGTTRTIESFLDIIMKTFTSPSTSPAR